MISQSAYLGFRLQQVKTPQNKQQHIAVVYYSVLLIRD